ncbi:MAG: chemotaxis protein CheA [bacterium]
MPENKALKEFIAESEELIEEIEKKLFSFEEMVSEGKESPELINALFRDFHTLKGISGMFGFSNLSNLSHQLESFLDKIRLGKLDLDSEVFELLSNGKELVRNLVKEIAEHGKDDVPVGAFIESISQIFTKSSTKEDKISPLVSQLKNVLTEYEEHRLNDNLKKGRNIYALQFTFSLEEFDTRLNEITAILKSAGELISTLPKPSDQPGNIVFSLIFATDKTPEQLPTKDKFIYEIEKLNDEKLIKTEEKESPIKDTEIGQLKSISNTIRVDIAKLDNLMNIVGELVTQKAEILQLIEKTKLYTNNSELNLTLSKVVNSLGKKINELQEAVMTVRMVPLNQLFEKLERNVKKIAHELKKELMVVVKGGDTELDKYIVEELADPLMHIIRNAVDHGIESPEERQKKGKPAVGHIELLAYQKGNNVFIEVKDDGKGIDLEKIREKLIRSGKISADQDVSEEYLIQTIFTPGFSEKDVATEISGRGVGLDVVKSNLARLRGIVDVKTEKGGGTSFILTLPLTLIIIQSIIIKTSEKLFAIPISAVEEVVEITKDRLLKISGEDVVNIRNAALPVSYLEKIFDFGDCPEKFNFLVVLKVGEKKAGLVVEQIVGYSDIVIKSMGKYIKTRGIAGATQIGDGKMILVLDPSGILEEIGAKV